MEAEDLLVDVQVQASKTFELCAREASQIIGGSSYVRPRSMAECSQAAASHRQTQLVWNSSLFNSIFVC